MRKILAFCFSFLILMCGAEARAVKLPSESSTRQSSFLPYGQGWLGADDAYSVPLGGHKSLWLFGDTFVAPPGVPREHYTGFVRNTIAISNCPTPQHCTFEYYWRGKGTSKPGDVFETGTKDWFWPMDGFIDHGTLYVALMQMHNVGHGNPFAFGFAYSGVQLASIKNYTDPPSQWSITYQKLNTGEEAVPGVSIIVGEGPGGNPDPSNPRGGKYAYFFTLVGSSHPATQYMALLRLPLAQLKHCARPGKADWEYLKSDSTWGAWASTATALPSNRAVVLKPGATEMTVRYHHSTRQWLALYPIGLARSAYYSLAPSLTGPWGKPESLYTYPEMQSSNPNYTPNVFCYAIKEHTELEEPGKLFFTYACNSTHEDEVIKNMNLYHPVVVIRPLPRH